MHVHVHDARLAMSMAPPGVVSDVWSSCATDPACCCNELTTAPLTVTLQPNGVADADKRLSMAKVCPPSKIPAVAVPDLGSCTSSGRAWRLWAAWHSQGERLGHWAPSHRLGCSSQPPPASPTALPLAT